MITATRRLPLRMVFLCGSVWLGGCLGEASGPSVEGSKPHPIHGSWYSELLPYGDGKYQFYENEYRTDSRLMTRFHHFHRNSLTDHLVLDSITEPLLRTTYTLEGDIVTKNVFRPVGDTLVLIDRYRYAIGGDSLGLQGCIILGGTGTSLEGRWETRLPSIYGPIRVVVEFLDGMRRDSIYYIDRPPEATEPRGYRLIDDSTFAMVTPLDSSLDTLGFRIRRDSLVILQNLHMAAMFRTQPDISKN